VIVPTLPAIRLVQVQPAHYLAVEGKGEPEGAAFGRATEALLRVAEAVRARHAAAGRNFALAPPELLVWSNSAAWQVLIRVPDTVRAGEVTTARRSFHALHREECRGVRLLRLEEGTCLEAACAGRPTSEIAGALASKARELGAALVEPRHEIRRPGETLVRQRLALAAVKPPRPPLRHRRVRARGVPARWKARA
jgi:hypothetical protein